MSMSSGVQSLQSFVALAGSLLQSPLLFVLRAWWGWQFFQTGKGKLENLDKTTQFFASLGLPAPGLNAAVAGATECLGGLLLLIGLGSRVVAIPLAFTMIVAYATAHRAAAAAILSNPDGFVEQAPFLFLLVSLLVLAFGPGAISVDGFLSGRGTGDGKPAPVR
jgi:putative oxidoreductase